MEEDKQIRGVVFDLDGLMFNTEDLYLQVGTEVLRRRGKAFTPELVDAMMGLRPPQAIGLMIDWHSLEATVEEIETESREIFLPLLDNDLQPMFGLIELLDRIEAAKIPKAVATSSGRLFAEEVLGRFDLLRRFQFILTGEDVQHGKPNPEIYLLAADRFGLAAEELLVLEDSQTGTAAGVASGAVVVAVPGKHSDHHNFTGATFIAENLKDPRIYALLAHRSE